jgi:hypothetical protein
MNNPTILWHIYAMQELLSHRNLETQQLHNNKESGVFSMPNRTALIARQHCSKHSSAAADWRVAEQHLYRQNGYVTVEQAVFFPCFRLRVYRGDWNSLEGSSWRETAA